MRLDESQPLDEALLEEYSDRWDFHIDTETLAAFEGEFQTQNELLKRLEEFDDDSSPKREYRWVDDEEDPLAGFLTVCEVSETDTGPLADLELAIKDNIAVAGVPMTCGSTIMESFHPRRDATVVSRLLDAGATITGKANMDEFAFGGDTSTMAFRLARNPRNPEHQPGGSSAGSGVAVANEDVDAALGSDTGGSVRFPAAWCGVVGVKPTRGLVSLDGFIQFSKTLDTIGPLARDTLTVAKVLKAMAGKDPADEQTHDATVGTYVESVERGRHEDLSDVTIGVPEELMGKHEALDANARAAIDQLEDEGADIVSVTIPNYEYVVPAWLAIGMTEMTAYMRASGQNYWLDSQARPSLVAALNKSLQVRGDELGDTVRSSLLYGEYLNDSLGDQYYALGTRVRRAVTEDVASLFEDVQVLASTGVPMLPPKWGEEITDLFSAMSNTCPFNLTGHPAMVLPSGTVDGLPSSLQFVAPHFDEETLFRVGAKYEAVSGD